MAVQRLNIDPFPAGVNRSQADRTLQRQQQRRQQQRESHHQQ